VLWRGRHIVPCTVTAVRVRLPSRVYLLGDFTCVLGVCACVRMWVFAIGVVGVSSGVLLCCVAQ
jgi:hypothetical protein